MARDRLAIEITRLIGELHPTAFDGDLKAIAQATAGVADAFGGMLAVTRKSAPNDAMFEAAARMMIERALRFAQDAQAEADSLRAHAAPAYHEASHGQP